MTILRVDAESGQVIRGSEIPNRVGATALEHLLVDGEPQLFAIAHGHLIRVSVESPTVSPPTVLSCRQLDLDEEVELTFTNNGPYDRLEVYRDCAKLADVEGTASRYLDTAAPAGWREYAVRGVTGAELSDVARCALRVGTGAILEREYTWPVTYPAQITVDPADGSLYVTAERSSEIHRFDSDLLYVDSRELSVLSPWGILTLSIRVTPAGASTLYVILRDGDQRFQLRSETMSGELLDQVEIFPPQQPDPIWLDPLALTWDSATDTFYYLESSAETIVQMNPEGRQLRTFPHPIPPANHFIRNQGLWIEPDRGTLFTTPHELPHRRGQRGRTESVASR